MKFRPVSLVALAALVSAARADRVETVFNRDFRFAFGASPSAASPEFDDSGWDRVGIPHSFSIPYFRSPRFPVGEGWYRKHLVLEAADGRRRRLDFESVFQSCDVYVNGVRAGGHLGGYTGFSVDLTPYLKNGDNVIAIRVDNRWRPDLPPRSGEHVFSGGIYRDVKLVTTGAARLLRNGVRATTPAVAADKASVEIDTRYDIGGAKGATVKVEILDRDGRTVAVTDDTAETGVETSVSGPDNQIVTTTGHRTLSLEIKNPKLWSPASPYLYTARVSVLLDSAVSDSTSVRFGVRTFRFDKDRGFFLNGEHLWLQGANRHQDQAGWGDAVANTGHYRDAKLLKEAGFNFVRGSHYPHDPAFLDACDELGLIVWSENPFWGIGGSGPDNGTWSCSAYPPNAADQQGFEANDRRLLGEMIDDLYNHPSIVVWSMSNEPFFTAKAVMDKAKKHMADLVDDAHRLDPSRAVGVGGAQRAGFDKFGDVIGYNGDGARFPKPDRPSVVSEYGSHVENRPGTYAPFWGDTKGEKPAWRAGEAIWCGFHHGSIAGDMGRMGIVDYFRLPLRQWYWYRDHLAHVAPPEWPKPGKPAAIRLTTDRETLSNDGTQDAHLVAALVDAAGRQVAASPDLTLEIVSGPGEFPTGPAITFRHDTDIDIRDGAAAVAFRSWHGGKTVIRARSAGLPDATLALTTLGEPSWSPGYAAEWQKPRPYVPGGGAKPAERRLMDNLGAGRPARASSSRDDAHSPDKANDGDAATAWIAGASAAPASWRLDLENFYAVSAVKATFADDAKRDVALQISDDGEHWTDLAGATGAKGDIVLRARKETRGRFIRLVFRGAPPAVSEIAVSGFVD